MIRRARTEDLELVKAVRLAALADSPSAYATTLEQEAALEDRVWRDRLGSDRHPTFLWSDEEGVQGMVVGVIDDADHDVAHLFAMWVRPAARGSGIGGQLVTHVLGWAADHSATAVRLRVTSGNEGAERLYARHGFTRTGRAERRARDGLVEFEMEASLARNRR